MRRMLSQTLLRYTKARGKSEYKISCWASLKFNWLKVYLKLFCSGGLHFLAANNDSGVREYDMEKFQLMNHFRFPWPVNVSFLSTFYCFFYSSIYLLFSVAWKVKRCYWHPIIGFVNTSFFKKLSIYLLLFMKKRTECLLSLQIRISSFIWFSAGLNNFTLHAWYHMILFGMHVSSALSLSCIRNFIGYLCSILQWAQIARFLLLSGMISMVYSLIRATER